jgi:glycine dehydrogenase subunit 2
MSDVPSIFESGRPGRANAYFSNGHSLEEFLPKTVIRDELPLPENSELDVVRHFTRLAQRTFSIDSGFYPLGSCTMKYNPRINEAMAALPGFRDLHPFAPTDLCQGALAATYELQRLLSSIFGMAEFSLNPAAGAHAELAALLIAKAYFRDRGENRARTTVIVPDTAHGTNPASAAMVGYKVVSLKSDERGRVGVDVLKAALGPDTAVCMMTNPNTLGLFEDHILEIAAAVHAAGGLMYYDGANANALMGNTRPGDMGFDLMHLNLHKTFSIPHGGGGAGAGPIGVAEPFVKYLPTPIATRDERGTYRLDFDRPKSIGQMRSFWSNFAHVVRALTYIYANGLEEDLRARRLERELPARARQGVLGDAVRRAVPSRVRRLGTEAEARDRRASARHREGVARSRLSRSDDLFSAARPRVSDDRADRNGIQGDARRFHRGAARDRRNREDRPGGDHLRAGAYGRRSRRRNPRRPPTRLALETSVGLSLT